VSKPAKELISKILVPDSKRIIIQDIYNDPWILKESTKNPLKLTFGKLQNFSKFSKVYYLDSIDKKVSCDLYRYSAFIKVNREPRKPIQADRFKSRWLNIDIRIKNCLERLEKHSYSQIVSKRNVSNRH